MASPRPGVWVVRIDGGRDPVTGRRRQISRTVQGTKRDAQRVLNEMAVDADKGRFTGTNTTFRQLSEEWLELARADLSPTTVRSYRGLLDNYILPSIGDVPVKNIQTLDLDQLYHGLLNRFGLSSNTVRNTHTIIRRAFRQAVLWGWIVSNPAANATAPRLIKPNLSPPDVEQVGELLQAASKRDPELGHFLHLAATTGARRGELCALRWHNVDAKQGTLLIERAIIDTKGGIIEKDTKTHASRRIAIDKGTLAVLEAQRDLALGRSVIIGLGVDEYAYVFSIEPDGSIPWRPDRVTKRFGALREELGYHKIRLHDLRHFAATRLMAAGVPVRTVSGRLGHANPSTTLSVYSHFVQASDRDAATVMGGLVTKGGAARKGTKRNAATRAQKVARAEPRQGAKSSVKMSPAKRTGGSVRGR
jgi:integrase